MTTITLHLPDDTPLAALRGMADGIDCDLRLLPDGSYQARPRHTNANVVRMPRRKRQYMHTHLPDGPEVA